MKTKFKQTEIGMIPEDWGIKELKDVASYITEKISICEVDLTNFISTENMLSNKGGITVASSLPKVGKVTQFKEGDILFSNIRTYFKKLWFARFSGGCSNDVLVIRKKSTINNKYLYYYLSQDKFFDFTVLTSKGTKMPRGDKNSIMSYGVNIPPLPEQSAIAKILSDLDAKIELNQKMNKTLEAIGQAIFKHWFVDFEFPNEEGKPYKSSSGKMVESELGKIPEEWKVGKLGEYVDSISGCSYTSKGLEDSENALVTLKSISINGFSQEGFKEYTGEYKDKHIVKDGDIVVAHTDLTQNRIILGKPAIVRDLGKYKVMIASMDLSIVHPRDLLNRPYLFYLLNTRKFHEHAQGYSNGTTVIHLSRKAIPDFTFVVPKEDILDKFKSISNKLFDKISNNQKEMLSLQKTRDLLLPKLMTGKIRVPVEVLKYKRKVKVI